MSVNVYDPVNNTLIPIAGATLYADTPVGFIGAFDAEEVPAGWLIFNGQTVLRSDYPDLWARANRNNQVGVGKFYGIGDGSTTFTLADLRETSLKGYGETSRSVGAHVKSGGLGIGEFLDDQLQNHGHANEHIQDGTGNNYGHVDGGNWNFKAMTTYGVTGARFGITTEVKAVGVVWAVKARMTGLPIDLQQKMEDRIKWKFIDSKVGRTIINCDFSKYNEIMVVFKLFSNEKLYMLSQTIPLYMYTLLGSSTYSCGFGGTLNTATPNGARALWSIGNNQIKLEASVYDGNDQTSQTTTYLFAR